MAESTSDKTVSEMFDSLQERIFSMEKMDQARNEREDNSRHWIGEEGEAPGGRQASGKDRSHDHGMDQAAAVNPNLQAFMDKLLHAPRDAHAPFRGPDPSPPHPPPGILHRLLGGSTADFVTALATVAHAISICFTIVTLLDDVRAGRFVEHSSSHAMIAIFVGALGGFFVAVRREGALGGVMKVNKRYGLVMLVFTVILAGLTWVDGWVNGRG